MNWTTDDTCYRKGKFNGNLNIFEHILAIITLFLFVGYSYILILIIFPFSFLYIYYNPTNYIFITFFALFISTSFLPVDYEPSNSWNESYIMRLWARYFSFEWKIIEKLNPKEQYVLAEEPHGIFPMSTVISLTISRKAFPDCIISGVAASILFRIPLYRQLYAQGFGCHPASKKSIHGIFEKHENCVIIVGGIAEMFLEGNENEERLFLKERKGFIKVSLKEGRPIVPIFFYGNSLLLKLVGGSEDNPKSLFARISRKLRISIAFFYGRWYLPIPFRKKVKMVTGNIIKLPQINEPTIDEINKYHDKYIKAIKELYENERPKWEKRKLVIV